MRRLCTGDRLSVLDKCSRAGRHTFVTRLIRGGEDLITVAEMTGHARLDTLRVHGQPPRRTNSTPCDTSPSTADRQGPCR